MRSLLHAFLAAGFLCLSSCADGELDLLSQGRIEIDVSPLHSLMVGDVRQNCISVAEEAVLRIDGRRRLGQPITQLSGSVIFEDVEVPLGSVRFDVDIRSTNDALLYTGGVIAEIEADQFNVGIDLEHANGVLLVCPPEQQVLDYGFLTFENIGDRPIEVRILQQSDACDGAPCLNFSEPQFKLPGGESRTFHFTVAPSGSRRHDVQIESTVGHVDVIVWTN